MEKKIKTGISGKLIASIILGLMGIIYLPIGIFSLMAGENSEMLILGLVFTGVGAVILAIAAILLALDLKKRKAIKEMVENNQYIWGEVVAIDRNRSIQVNGRNPYVVKVRYQDRRGLLHVFSSQNIFQFLDPSIIGRQVRVYYLDESFKDYFVDVDEILPTFIEH